MTITTDIQKLNPGEKYEFFELDGTEIGTGIVHFHGIAGHGMLTWQGVEYSPWPIRAEGFGRTSEQQPRPKLAVGNVDGSISLLCSLYEDMVGAKVTRRRTFGKYLDAINFDGANILTNGTFDTDISGWTVAAGTVTWDSAGKRMRLQDAGVPSVVRQAFATQAGQEYRLRFTSDSVWNISRVGTTPSGSELLAQETATVGTNERTFTATGTLTYVTFSRVASATEGHFDDITIKPAGVNPTADATQEFTPEVWYIDRKAGEDRDAVEFELATPLDFQGVKLPRRQIIQNYCPWEYRSAECNYTGGPVATILDVPTTDPDEDNCGRRFSSCELRDWPDDVLNFGGFLAAGLVRT